MSENSYIPTLKKHLRILCIISTLVIPIINNFALSLWLSVIQGDIMFKTLYDVLSVFISALDTLNLFLVFAVLVNSLIRLGVKNSYEIIALCFIRIFIVYSSYISIGAIVTTNFTSTLKGNILYCITNAVIDVMLITGTIILCRILLSKYTEISVESSLKGLSPKNNPFVHILVWVTLLVSTFLLSGCIINTVTDISVYGSDNLNASEIIYLVSPYLRWIFKTVFGYAVMLFVSRRLDVQNISASQPKQDKNQG